MTEEASEDDRLFEEALDLIIRLQNDQTSPVTRDLIKCWRARGPDHEMAWAEAAELHGMAGKIIDDRRAAAREQGTISRRGVVLGGTAALIAGGVGLTLGPELLLRARADHLTSTAELRRVALSDGSTVTLGPDSAIRVEFTADHRQTRLLTGMAYFEVASDPVRSFGVDLDGLHLEAIDTAFEVSRDAGFLNVSVDSGMVETQTPQLREAGNESLAAGQWLKLNEATGDVERGSGEPGQVAAWRDGFVIADRDAVSSVVARIARWQPGRVVIADASLGAKRISGVFDLDNPISALKAVIQPHGGRVRQISPWLTVISSI